MPLINAACGLCKKPLSEEQKLIRVKECGDLYHDNCFFKGSHRKVEGAVTKFFCPAGCAKELVSAEHKQLDAELEKKIEAIDFSKKKSSVTWAKVMTYIAVAFTVTIISAVIYTSWIGLGIGVLASIPLAWLSGKLIDRIVSSGPYR